LVPSDDDSYVTQQRARPRRLPVCELCKRSPASVYCHEDAAALCAGCDAEVHSANPLPHTIAAIEQAMVRLVRGLQCMEHRNRDPGRGACGLLP
jgi:hypothetical protein